jgi:hypothetical protein
MWRLLHYLIRDHLKVYYWDPKDRVRLFIDDHALLFKDWGEY